MNLGAFLVFLDEEMTLPLFAVGCCNLRVEHLTLLANDELEFDFLGKDSIRYYNKVRSKID